ncbi:TPA: glycosyltransferase family 2 protein [Aeromonas sobria]|nr:glycosyltransferase family 2 protein [Aeromonas sobria]
MSLKNGNNCLRNEQYELALLEYNKIPKDSPLYEQACLNIERIKKLGFLVEKKPILDSVCPLLSIIMPVFNVGPYLDASILSVLSQTLADFELIIVNDASTDNGKRIIEMYKNIDPRIRFIDLHFNTLGGAGIPSNIGINAAKGKYIGFVDSDDWVVNDAFEKLVSAAEKFNAELVIGDFNTFDQETRVVSPAYDKERWNGIPLEQVTSGHLNPQLFKISPVPWRKLYLASFIKNNKICYPEGDYFYEDNPLHWFVLSEAERVVVIDNIISYHRMAREGQTMSSALYKLSAISSHINTVANFLIKKPIKKQTVVDEFYDYLYRANWTVTRQSDPITKKIIKRRLFDIYHKSTAVMPPVNLSKDLEGRFADYKNAYPKLDLTVVIPVYNCEDLISESIESVLRISKLKFDVLIIDDGSSDNTAAICQRYADKNNNVHFYQQGNKGAGRARNSVIPLCTGRYTFFLDADDVINAAALERAVGQASTENADLLFMKYKLEFFEDKILRGMFGSDEKLWASIKAANSTKEIRNPVASLINYPWNRIIKTDLLHDENIFFGPTVVHNDIPYHWHSVITAKKISYTDDEVCTHRKFSTRNQITNISDDRRLMVFEALRYTQERSMQYPEFSDIKPQWITFSSDLIEWAKDRVPENLQDSFNDYKQEFINNLPN